MWYKAGMPSTRTYRREVINWYLGHGRDFPWRRTSDPYAILVAEVLLQRTTSTHVEAIYAEFLRRWPNPKGLARARVSSIAAVTRPLGLRQRAANLKGLGRQLVELGEVPLDPGALEMLHGVGPYTAHMIPVLAQDQPLPVVDWVIARVLRRYFGLSDGRRPNADSDLWSLAKSLSASGQARALWLGTLDLAAIICRRVPLCHECPLRATCSHACHPVRLE